MTRLKYFCYFIWFLLVGSSLSCERDVIHNRKAGTHSVQKNNVEWITTIQTSVNKKNLDVFSFSITNDSYDFEAPWGNLNFYFVPKSVDIFTPIKPGSGNWEMSAIYISSIDPAETTNLGNYDLLEPYNNYLEITHLCKKDVEGFLDMAFVAESDFVAMNSGEPDTLYFKGDFSVKLPRK